ncbi:hypothetical protein F5882DRAFT_33043 [Hyaloscypha sp. PMI_1271]|nr:hypothetical protein F5882DRAFT_33043 [Hyaloscypha sp. PMI_1271]
MPGGRATVRRCFSPGPGRVASFSFLHLSVVHQSISPSPSPNPSSIFVNHTPNAGLTSPLFTNAFLHDLSDDLYCNFHSPSLLLPYLPSPSSSSSSSPSSRLTPRASRLASATTTTPSLCLRLHLHLSSPRYNISQTHATTATFDSAPSFRLRPFIYATCN